MAVLLVAVGGAVGSVLRYWVGLLVAGWLGTAFPWGTLLINIGGSFVIGWMASATPPETAGLRLLVMVGFCGGFTTFSSFSLQTLELMQRGDWIGAWGNVLGSVLLCLGAVTAGWALGRA